MKKAIHNILGKMLKKLIQFWWIPLIILLYLFFGTMRWLPSDWNIFSSGPSVIKDTPIEIEQIRAMGTLISAEFYGEVYADLGEVYTRVINKHNKQWSEKEDSLSQLYSQIVRFRDKGQDVEKIDNLVYIGRGWSKAGTDLSNLKETDFKLISGKPDTLVVSVPKPVILTTNINPWYVDDKIPGYEIFIGERLKNLTHHEVKELKLLCKEKLKAEAIRHGILDAASRSADKGLANFFRLLAYEHVRIEIKTEATVLE